LELRNPWHFRQIMVLSLFDSCGEERGEERRGEERKRELLCYAYNYA